MDRSHISVLGKEESVEVTIVVEHLASYKRPVRSTFRSEAIDIKKRGFTPHRSVPESAQLRTKGSFGNAVTVAAHSSFCMNGAAILSSTFSLTLLLFQTISTTGEAMPASEPCSRFHNRDILAPSSLLRIRERLDHSPCTRIHCLASLSPPRSVFNSIIIILHLLSAAPNR
jgi:hypothetical protein